MMPQGFLLVAIAFAGTIVALAAPVQRNQAVIIHDGILEIRDYALARRAVKEVGELAVPRTPGHYVKAIGCPHGCHFGPALFTRPGSVDMHLIQNHKGSIPVGWLEPATLPAGKRGVRRYPLGENGYSTASMNRIVHDYPQAAEHLKAQRMIMGLYTAHMPGGPFPLPGIPQVESLAVPDPAVVEHMKALRLAENLRLKNKRAAMQTAAAADLEIAKRLELERSGKRQNHYAKRAAMRPAAAIDPELAQDLEAKYLAANQSRNARRVAKRAAMRAAAATDLGIAKRLELERLNKNQHQNAKRACSTADPELAERLRAKEHAQYLARRAKRTAMGPGSATNLELATGECTEAERLAENQSRNARPL